ncbi:hypothetical protein JMY81_16065 [Brenneria goodwinii]|uniref:hypothetical protein n=1 Tax=Brenneria goodwinii TaxID=1109412 RepID=UPI000EF1BCD7|nr:hypothetical protein [Brenneria goodwinii]MCG8155929.1 hypothetical protein [Brenneria goodwinii]MCG8162322.1 hypothetical protein [Brenneria goodwinii]MCG8166957.1 hypothetical protein [Brenneria goodwinii]MCG8169631.1 hypothetical protein [Brenneria goodwinii]MCG8174763.1 hypothetical protein [Brenneria goodwinii]
MIEANARAAQGLTCFHGYKDQRLKTLDIDMLYTTLDSFESRTIIGFSDSCSDIIETPKDADYSSAINFIKKYIDRPIIFKTNNNFDPDIGLASSSSGYACIAGCLTKLLQLSEKPQKISSLARSGSFSASASVSGGISIVRRAKNGVPTYGECIFKSSELKELSIVVAFSRYNKNNYDFYNEAKSSPVLKPARKWMKGTAQEMISAIEKHDIDKLACMSERHAILNYAVLHTGRNNLFLWKPHTISTLLFVKELREKKGEPVFASMNTGANVFIYCFSNNATNKVEQGLKNLDILFKTSKVGDGIKIRSIG